MRTSRAPVATASSSSGPTGTPAALTPSTGAAPADGAAAPGARAARTRTPGSRRRTAAMYPPSGSAQPQVVGVTGDGDRHHHGGHRQQRAGRVAQRGLAQAVGAVEGQRGEDAADQPADVAAERD